jgi:hypothetical protein
MAKTVDITASYVGNSITSVDIYSAWPVGGTLLSGSYSESDLLSGIRLTNINDNIFDFFLVDTATSASSISKALPGPTITEFNPTQGTVGDTIGVTGSGFIGTTYVELGFKNVTTFITSSNTRMQITVPVDATGSTFLIVSNPKGSTLRSGWQYTVGGNPVVYSLGSFAVGFSPESVCPEDIGELQLYTSLGTTIAEALANNSIVYIDPSATVLASPGWYKQIPNTTEGIVYYIDGDSRVVETSNCSGGSGGTDEGTTDSFGGGKEIVVEN